MSKRSNGLLVGRSRHLARHHKPSTLNVDTFIKTFEIGDKVAIVQKSNVRNIPHPRYKGKIGTVLAKRGSAYVIEIKAITKKRTLIVPVVHLERAK